MSELRERPSLPPAPAARGLGFRTPLAHRVIERAIAVVAGGALAALLAIVVFVAREALPLLWEPGSLGELFAPRRWAGYDAPALVWQPVGAEPKLNVVPLLVGTLKVTVMAMLVSAPLGVACAIYVAKLAPRGLREWLKPAIELLAAVPGVVLGFFALVAISGGVESLFDLTYRLNGLVAALGLALAVVPVVFTLSEDAISAVPRSLEEAALALGARRWQVVLRVVVPAALPGIAAAVLLGLGRAIGETMIVLMASGNAAVVRLFDPTSSVRTVTATIAGELGEVAQGERHWRVLFLLGLLLLALTWGLQRVGALVIARLRRRWSAEDA
jgi:phosphate transport system permease protein